MSSLSNEIFLIPANSNLSWASMLLASLIVLDVSTEVGEYHRAIAAQWGDSRRQRQAKKAVNRVALEVVLVWMAFIILSAFAVAKLTRDMDWRMTLVLEGLSRLEAAHCLAFISVKTPRWIGVYYSQTKERRIQDIGMGIEQLRFHVRYSISQYFIIVYCCMLPFAGRPISALLGFILGFLVEVIISYARKGDGKRQARVALTVAFVFGFLSNVLFADGCHYIQVVWGTRVWKNEWGLGLLTFSISFSMVAYAHYYQWRQTELKMATNKRMSVHDREEKMAISLIFSHVFGSRMAPHGQLIPMEEMGKIQEEDDEPQENDEDIVKPSTWTLLKQRWSAPSDLVIFSRNEHRVCWLISLASLFLVIVNIGATSQMNVVRQHFHSVHTKLYGNMEQGPVCAFDKVGGTIATFPSRNDAHSAGYQVAHCGACGACSDWHNLRLQYSTREYLAKESARCARKSLIGGRNAVFNCLGEEPIGFQGKCAECWTEDIFCARSHCAFIFLQSNMINTVANFQVSEDTITAATCEEAMCELAFVPCSGANRRRMHITSTIARPGRQLCDIVDVDWSEVFGGEQDPALLPSDKIRADEL